MAIFRITQVPDAPIEVRNGDRIVLDIPDGSTVEIVAANSSVRNFRIDYGSDVARDYEVVVKVDTFTPNGLQIQAVGYDPSDELRLDGAENVQTATPTINQVTFNYGNGNTGTAKILDPGERDLTDDPPPIVICFAEGTMIGTEMGPRAVESLRVGDLVRTLDNDLQPIRWIGARRLDGPELARNPHLHPVRITAGALGAGLPLSDLTVSPQHRIHLADWRAELLFGLPEVLVPAKALVGAPGIGPAAVNAVTYLHILFDAHELIWSNGLLTESLHPGEVAMSAVGEAWDGPEPSSLRDRRTARPALRVEDARAAACYVV